MSSPLRVDRDGPLVVLTLDDPERANPLSPAMMVALTEALEAAASRTDIRAVVLAGAGRHFSAGADLVALERVAAGGGSAANLEDSERLRRLFEVLLGSPKLTVAAVHGAAVAGGCGLATACDLVVAGPRARFCYTEVKIGFVAAVVLTFLTRRVAGHVARRLLLDPEPVAAEAALDLGLVDRLAEEGAELEAAKSWAMAICRTASPAALATTKRLLNATVGAGWQEALKIAADINVEQRMHPECRRGVRHFLESKTTPDWLEDAGD